MKYKKIIAIISIVVVVIIALFLVLRACNYNTGYNEPANESTSKPLDYIPIGEANRISIPAVTGLVLNAGSICQTVNLHNPSENSCFFIISIYLSDDTLVYQSDYLAPSERVTEIELNQELQRGVYRNCRMVYSCYSLDNKSPLNSGETIIEITVK